MGKLQPNFSWQKYEGEPEDQREQFQYQLQSQHIQVSNSVNATIDDESFWTKERPTAFTWINGKQIYTKTITGVIVGTAATPYATSITGLTGLVRIEGIMQNTGTLTDAEPLPYLDPTSLAAGVGVYVQIAIVSGLQVVTLYINAGNNDFSGYSFAVTIEYTK